MDTQYSGKLSGKMLYFMEQTDGAFDAVNDCMAVPVERFKGFRANGTATQLLMEFDRWLHLLEKLPFPNHRYGHLV